MKILNQLIIVHNYYLTGRTHVSRMEYVMIMYILNKANLRDLIAAAGLVMLLKS